MLELDDVRRRQVVRDQDRLLLGAAARQRARLAHQPLQHALDDLHDVGLALAQVRVLDLVELLDQHVHLLRQRPLGVAALLGDDLLRRLDSVGSFRIIQCTSRNAPNSPGTSPLVIAPCSALELLLHFA